MKKLLYILLLLPCLAWGQATKQWSITPTTGPNKGNGYPEWYAGNFPGYLGIPYGTNALLGRSADMDGLLYFQLSDSTLQVRIGGAWIPVGKKTAANYLYVSALYFGGSATFDDPMTVINSDSVGHHAPDYFAPGIRNLTINGITHNLTADQIWTISGIAASNSDSLGHQPASYYQQQLNGTGFVKATGTAISYDNTAYVPQSGAFTISGEKQSTYTPLALQDLARLADLELVNTVLTGMLVTTVTTTATIPSGTYRLDNLTYAWSGGTVTIPAQDATKYRYSILYITTPGTIAISNGSLVDTDPVIPTFPANSVEVAIIYIPPVGQTVTVTGGGKKTTGTVTRISPGWGMNFPPITTTGLVTADSLKVQSVLGFFPKGDTRWQKILISGTNIKTINGVSPLGSGNISIPSVNLYNSDGTVDTDRTVNAATHEISFIGASGIYKSNFNFAGTLVNFSSTDTVANYTSYVATNAPGSQLLLGRKNNANSFATGFYMGDGFAGLLVQDQLDSVGLVADVSVDTAKMAANPKAYVTNEFMTGRIAAGAPSGLYLPLNLTRDTAVSVNDKILNFDFANGGLAERYFKIGNVGGDEQIVMRSGDNTGVGGSSINTSMFSLDEGITIIGGYYYPLTLGGFPSFKDIAFTRDGGIVVTDESPGVSPGPGIINNADYSAKIKLNDLALTQWGMVKSAIDSLHTVISGSGFVSASRTLTINGVSHDLTADQSWSVGTLTASNFVTAEVPSGSINSSNTAFTLANTPTTGTVKAYRNGMRQIVGVDYTISGTAITYLYAPSTGDSLIFDYQK